MPAKKREAMRERAQSAMADDVDHVVAPTVPVVRADVGDELLVVGARMAQLVDGIPADRVGGTSVAGAV